MDLNTVWFLLIAVLITGYALLDGFDLGVGVLHLFARNESERRQHVAAIGPVWDGNEVWLLTGGGALFAAFPAVYATVFSGFYLALMLLIVALILRAVSLEFRHAVDHPRWRRVWDVCFGVGSLVPSVLFGVAVGNVLRGVPIAADGNFAGSFLGLLNPYSLLMGLVSLSAFVVHGALYLRMKTSGELADRLGRWAYRSWAAFLVLYAAASVATRMGSGFLFERIHARPPFWALVVLLGVGIVGVPTANRAGKTGRAFLASCATLTAMIGLAAVGLYPRLVPALGDLSRSLDIYNSASSPKTLSVMLVIALVGMPLVLLYTIVIYRVFKGKVTDGAGAYQADEPAKKEEARPAAK